MPSVALSSSSPTISVKVLSTSNWVAPPSVAVTLTVLAPPFSASEAWTFSVSLSASTARASVVGAASSLVMVPVASASLMVAPTGSVSSTKKASLASFSVSSVVATVKVCVPTPLAKSSFVAVVAGM